MDMNGWITTINLSRRFPQGILLLLLGLVIGGTLAQTYPTRPIRIVVNMSAGGALDTTARLIGPKMAEALGHPVIVENRGGAGGTIGMNAVAKAEADGYTILLTTTGIALSPALYRRLPFDATKDFIPVSQLVASTMVLIAGAKLPAASVKDVIALAKAKPGGLNYGHTGVGSQGQLSMELLKMSTGVDILAIPYKGEALVGTALMAGEVDLAVLPLSSNLQHFVSGRLRPLSVLSARRSAKLPNVPTAASDITGFEAASWHGLFVPARTAPDIVDRIQNEAVKALNAPDVRERLIATGLEIVGSTPDQFDAKYREDLAKYARIVKDTGIPPRD